MVKPSRKSTFRIRRDAKIVALVLLAVFTVRSVAEVAIGAVAPGIPAPVMMLGVALVMTAFYALVLWRLVLAPVQRRRTPSLAPAPQHQSRVRHLHLVASTADEGRHDAGRRMDRTVS